jgi:hypothetical protein
MCVCKKFSERRTCKVAAGNPIILKQPISPAHQLLLRQQVHDIDVAVPQMRPDNTQGGRFFREYN